MEFETILNNLNNYENDTLTCIIGDASDIFCCSFVDCSKQYTSSAALRFHAKKKHNCKIHLVNMDAIQRYKEAAKYSKQRSREKLRMQRVEDLRRRNKFTRVDVPCVFLKFSHI